MPALTAVPSTYTRSVGRNTAIFIVVSDFVEIVFVELAYKTGEVAVLEMFGQDVFCEFFVLQRPRQRSEGDQIRPNVRTSRTTKLSPSLPHRTTLSSCGFSNILGTTN